MCSTCGQRTTAVTSAAGYLAGDPVHPKHLGELDELGEYDAAPAIANSSSDTAAQPMSSASATAQADVP